MSFGDVSPPGREQGFALSQGSFTTPSLQKELSRLTPVLDNIDGIGIFADEAITQVRRGHSVDIFVVGRAGDGKSAISEQIIQKDRHSDRQPIRRRYWNTSMAVEEARARGAITSAFGQFTQEEYERLSGVIIKGKLNATEKTETGEPQLRILEFPAVEERINLGSSALDYAAERVTRDPTYKRRLIGVVGERSLHRRSRRMRKEVWEAKTPEELEQIFRKYSIVADRLIDPFDMRLRMGPPSSMDRIDADLTMQMLTRQDDIRAMGIDKSLPIVDKKSLMKDYDLEIRLLVDLYMFKALEKGFLESEVFIAINRLLRRKIPYYGSMRNDPALRL